MKKFLSLFLIVITLSACTVPTKKVAVSSASKITVAVALPNQLSIQTIGTTVFTNKSMKGVVSGATLQSRIRNIVNNQINSGGKAKAIKSNGRLDQTTSAKANPWSGKLTIPNKENLLQSAKASGANYLLFITGNQVQEPYYGTSIFINDIGVVQRSVFSIKNATSFAALHMIVFDTTTGQEASSRSLLASGERKGKPWITPKKLPIANEVEDIISGLSLQKEIGKALTEMGLR